MIDKLFLVATEFQFDAGSALLASNQVQSAAQSIEHSVNGALESVQRFGLGIASQFNILHLGLVGALHEALNVSNEYQKSQLSLVNSLYANREHLIGPIDTMNQKLEYADSIFQKLGKAAREFALDENGLTHMFAMTNNMLLPMGLAGTNSQNSIDMSRMLMKSLPSLGMVPEQVKGELINIIGGHAGSQNTLWRRLSAETNVFNGKHGEAATQLFNALPAIKRVEMLNEALAVFSSNTEVLDASIMSVSGQLRRISSLFTGQISSILRPLGDLLQNTIAPVLNKLGNYLDEEGRVLIEQAAKFLKPWLQDLTNSYTTLKQLKSLRTDMDLAKKLAELWGLFGMIRFVLKLFGLSVGFDFSKIGTVFTFLGTAARAAVPFLVTVGRLLFTMFWWVPVAVGALQLVSKAKAIADVENARILAQQAPEYTKQINRISTAFGIIVRPITALWNACAQALSWIFRLDGGLFFISYALKGLATILSSIAMEAAAWQSIFVGLWAVVKMFFNHLWGGISQLFNDVLALQEKVINTLKQLALELIATFTPLLEYFKQHQAAGVGASVGGMGLGQANEEYGPGFGYWRTFKDTAHNYFEDAMKQLMDPNSNMTVAQVVNVGSVNISQSFKEQMEPDRIAFAIRDTFLEAARNPISPRGSVTRNTGSR